MTFNDLKLVEPLQRAVADEGYTTPTPIQQKAIPPALEGRDVLGCAQTGTGKTAAFSLPILQRLTAKPVPQGRPIRALILTPTRELASQIGESFRVYGKHLSLTHAVIFGGVGQGAQEQALKRGVDILVATPGRLLDLASQGLVSYRSLEVFVLDEADRMLDMGFIHDVKRVIGQLPKVRQTLFFSATMPSDIQRLADSILKDPVKVAVAPVSSTAEKVAQQVYFVEKDAKRTLLNHLLADEAVERVLVFTRTKHGANKVAKQLVQAGVPAEAIHGNKSQNARERALSGFKSGALRVMVATDIAARGIDIDGLTHVVNYDLPNVPEQYVHRIGRTGRAGASGIAISFCDREERVFLKDIERTIRMSVPVASVPARLEVPVPVPMPEQILQAEANQQQGRAQNGGGGGGRSHQAAHPRGEGGRRHGGRGGGGGGGQRRDGHGQRRDGGGQQSRGHGGGGQHGGRGGGSGSSAPRPASAAPAAAGFERPRAPKWF